jgi:hypothetical protein
MVTLIVMFGPDDFEEYKRVSRFYVQDGALHIRQVGLDGFNKKHPIIIPNHAYQRAFESE